MLKFIMNLCPACNSQSKLMVNRNDGYSLHRCNNCTLVFCFPMPSDNDLNDYYDGFLHNSPLDMKDFLKKTARYEWAAEKIISDIHRYSVSSGNRLLDYGGGVGYYASAFSKHGYDVTLVDADSQSCNFARDSFENINVFELKTFNPTPDRVYDVIFCNQVIEHIRDIHLFVNNLKKLLAPKGLLILTTPNSNTIEHFFRPLWMYFGYVNKIEKNTLADLFNNLISYYSSPWACCDPPRHLYAFNKKSLLSLLSMNSFETKSCYAGYNGLHSYSPFSPLNYSFEGLKSIVETALNIYSEIGLRISNQLDVKQCYGENLVYIGTRD